MAEANKKKKSASGRGGWWFLAAMLLLHLVVRWVDPALSEVSVARFFATLKGLLPLFGIITREWFEDQF